MMDSSATDTDVTVAVDDEAGSFLVARVVAQSVNRPTAQRSYGMRVAEELIESALITSLREWPADDVREVFVRSLVSGLCEVAVKRTDRLQMRSTRHTLSHHTVDAVLEGALLEEERDSLSRLIAHDTVDAAVAEKSALLITRTLRRSFIRSQQRRLRSENTISADAVVQDEASYAARVLQRWVRERRAASTLTDARDAIVVRRDADDGNAELEATHASQRKRRQQSLIEKWMPIQHLPNFRSDRAAQSFLGRALGISGEERLSRADFEFIYDAFAASLRRIVTAWTNMVRLHAEQRHILSADEAKQRGTVENDYSEFSEAALYTSWVLLRGAEWAQETESICRAIADAEAADRTVLCDAEADDAGLLWKTRPIPTRRRIGRLQAALRTGFSLGSTLDAAHNVSSAPRHVSTPSVGGSTAKLSALPSQRAQSASVIRGQREVLDAVAAAAKCFDQSMKYERNASLRAARQRKKDDLERQRSLGRLAALEASRGRLTPTVDARRRPHTSSGAPRWFSDQVALAPVVGHDRTDITNTRVALRYDTVSTYAGKPPPRSAPASASRPPKAVAPRTTRTGASPSPVAATPSPEHTTTPSLFPVEQHAVDLMHRVATIGHDFDVSSQRLFAHCRNRMGPADRTAARFESYFAWEALSRRTLCTTDILALSPRSRIARWITEVSDLLVAGDVAAAVRVHETVHSEIAVYETATKRAKGGGEAYPPHDSFWLRIGYETNAATIAKSEGRIRDALQHVQRRMSLEEALPGDGIRSRPPNPLRTESGVSIETLLSASALLAMLNEPVAALQYSRSALHIVVAEAAKLDEELRKAASSETWAATETLQELQSDIARLCKAAALSLHNTAMAQLTCPTSVRRGEKAAAAATFRACVQVACLGVDPASPFVQRLRQSAAHFAADADRPDELPSSWSHIEADTHEASAWESSEL